MVHHGNRNVDHEEKHESGHAPMLIKGRDLADGKGGVDRQQKCHIAQKPGNDR